MKLYLLKIVYFHNIHSFSPIFLPLKTLPPRANARVELSTEPTLPVVIIKVRDESGSLICYLTYMQRREERQIERVGVL